MDSRHVVAYADRPNYWKQTRGERPPLLLNLEIDVRESKGSCVEFCSSEIEI